MARDRRPAVRLLDPRGRPRHADGRRLRVRQERPRARRALRGALAGGPRRAGRRRLARDRPRDHRGAPRRHRRRRPHAGALAAARRRHRHPRDHLLLGADGVGLRRRARPDDHRRGQRALRRARGRPAPARDAQPGPRAARSRRPRQPVLRGRRAPRPRPQGSPHREAGDGPPDGRRRRHAVRGRGRARPLGHRLRGPRGDARAAARRGHRQEDRRPSRCRRHLAVGRPAQRPVPSTVWWRRQGMSE